MLSTLNIHTENAPSGLLADRDPRSKLLMTLFLLAAVLSLRVHQPLQTVSLSLVFSGLLFLGGKPLRYYIKMILRVLPMMLLISIVLPFRSFDASEIPLLQFSFLSIYPSGLLQFIGLNIKFILVVSGTLILLTTTTAQELMKSLESFRLPSWLTAVLYFLAYYIYLLKEELYQQYLAYQSRYIHLSFRKRFGIIARMTIVYFIRVIDRSERVTMAMISRGFTGRIFSQQGLRWRFADSLLLVFTVLLIIIIKVFM